MKPSCRVAGDGIHEAAQSVGGADGTVPACSNDGAAGLRTDPVPLK
eukprot:CAMPEP_0113248160 /NCGR_PEP_ID=MMETSP0008_2-20120614/10372_1 /TAXON_ID=97485 /ORGANISM="Prymnesium parvum" /LENGTH=45 /DNA_ID=CAMNT_0000095997 /DNA_START=236 /DNA_END=373 /DNA_ORIENTATION=- /assembly_acc=CAM_ASM_000153